MRDVDPGPAAGGPPSGFRHSLHPYAGDSEFLNGTMSFIEGALAERETVLVAVDERKSRLLRAELTGPAAASVSFLDSDALDGNPARLIPAWRERITAAARGGRPVRAVGESRWTGRTAAQSTELRHHERLLNLAFARSSPAWWLLCPYDTGSVDPEALVSARRCHPLLITAGQHGPNGAFVDGPYQADRLTGPPAAHEILSFGPGDLGSVRTLVAGLARRHGLDAARTLDLTLAAGEVATNSLQHGGGSGTVRTWAEDGTLVCDFHDSGHLTDPLAGRVRPAHARPGGRGLWLVQQVCDTVQISSTPWDGTTVRLHMAVAGTGSC
ncbi:sensor histidine kinase [Kitasatospora purpeofusca]|uniref:sensor histidine kinase n=1 Tax=Kitasatospora purpeofusca TaxID=67352 RepID=UPI002A59C7B6|nr:sensor histidine kinase [Kitasatospora purpeofusca]MDY0814544.1 sensor histidine kinase [Kitasatospora purpeofusca]